MSLSYSQSQIVIVILLFILQPTNAFAQEVQQTTGSEKAKKVSEFLSRLESFGFNGSVLVAQKGAIVFAGGYGVAQPSTGKRWDLETAASIGSVVKQFTASAILKLEDEGKLSVTDKLADHFKDVPEDKARITLHQLLTHSSGFPPAIGDDFEEITREEYLRRAFETPLDFSPGGEYQYSNVAYSILAMTVEDVSGLRYEKFLRENFFNPAEMNHTGWRLPDWKATVVSESFDHEPPDNTILNLPENRWHIEGNGGLLSTPMDMYRWYQALQTEDILSEAAKDKMFTRQISEGPDANSFYGYGWVVMDTRRGGDVIWHNGGGAGGYFAIYQYVNDSAVFIVFSNKKIDGELPVDHVAVLLSNILFGDPVPMPPETVEMPANKLEGYTGSYVTGTARFKVIADSENNSLNLSPQGQDAMNTLFPSDMAGRLAQYNDLSEKFVAHLSQSEFESAARMFEDTAPLAELSDMLQRLWNEVGEKGEYKSVDVNGTRLTGYAECYMTLNFVNGSETLELDWMMGKCIGLRTEIPLPAKELRPIGPDSFASFSLMNGMTEVFFTRDGHITIQGPEREFKAKRIN